MTGQWIFQSAAAKNGRKGERITSPLRIIPDMPMFDSLHAEGEAVLPLPRPPPTSLF